MSHADTISGIDRAAFRDDLVERGLLLTTGVPGIYGRSAEFEDTLFRVDQIVERIGADDRLPERLVFRAAGNDNAPGPYAYTRTERGKRSGVPQQMSQRIALGAEPCQGLVIETREPLVPFNASGPANAPMVAFAAAAKAGGVWPFTHFNRMHVAPPLVITEAELVQGLAVLDEALAVADAEVAS